MRAQLGTLGLFVSLLPLPSLLGPLVQRANSVLPEQLRPHLLERIKLGAVQKYLSPRDPRVPAVLAVLDKLSAQAQAGNMEIVSSSDESNSIHKLLRFFAASFSAEARDGGWGALAMRHMRSLDDVGESDVSLLLFSMRPADDAQTQANYLLSAIGKMRQSGMIIVDGCGQGGSCEMIKHFAKAANWHPSAQEGMLVLERAQLGFEAITSPSISAGPTSNNVAGSNRRKIDQLEQTIDRLLRDGNMDGLFMSVYSPSHPHYLSFLNMAQLAKQRGGKTLVELGSAGGAQCQTTGGCSTMVLSRLARMIGGRLHSVTPLPGHVELARALAGMFSGWVEFYQNDPIVFLQSQTLRSIDLLHVTASDDSQRVAIIKTAEPSLHQNSIIALNGCQAAQDQCALATIYLQNLKWKAIPSGEQHKLFVRMTEADFVSQPQIIVAQPQIEPVRAITGSIMSALKEGSIDAIFSGLMDYHSGRYISFRTVAELAIQRKAVTMVETGTARNGVHNCGGDGCSTAILGRLAVLLSESSPPRPARLHTVDISRDNIDACRQGTSDLAPWVDYYVSDSVAFLHRFPHRIDVLYLDSYDYDGIEYGPSQQHHLNELLAAVDKLHDQTIIFLDDCSLAYEGKCKMASQWLETHGWMRIVDKYQRVYIRRDS